MARFLKADHYLNCHFAPVVLGVAIMSTKQAKDDLESDVEKLKDIKEQIIGAIGGFGKWQLQKCLFIVLVIWLPASFHLLNMVFFR